MPQPDGITAKLNKAKSVLTRANTAFPSPAKPAMPMNPTAPAAPKPSTDSDSSMLPGGTGIAEGIKARQDMAAQLPKMHKGGTVKKDGPVMLKAGETVRTPEQEKAMEEKLKVGPKAKAALTADEKPAEKPAAAPKAEKKAHKSKFKHTHIEHHDDGSHTVRHTPHAGADGKTGDEVSYGVKDMAGVHAGLDANVGDGQMPAAPAAPPAAAPAAGAMPAVTV
jgi:hypothetical protein